MTPRCLKRNLAVSLCLATIIACGLFPLGFPSESATPAPIQLVRCNAYPSALCLQSFGVGQNQLVISFYTPEAQATEFHLQVWQVDSAAAYPCSFTTGSPMILSCTGPLIPLGTPVRIEMYTENGREPLAEGDFTLTDLALPTLSGGESSTVEATWTSTEPASTATLEIGTVTPTVTESSPATISTGSPQP